MSRAGEFVLSDEGERTVIQERLTDEILLTLLQSNSDDELREIFPSLVDRARLRTYYISNSRAYDVDLKAADTLCKLSSSSSSSGGGGGGGGGGGTTTISSSSSSSSLLGKSKIYHQCKICKRTFTSSYGAKYHEMNKVCTKPPAPPPHHPLLSATATTKRNTSSNNWDPFPPVVTADTTTTIGAFCPSPIADNNS